jgi:hypothetical protein
MALSAAKACYRRAIEIADKQGAKLPKRRCSPSWVIGSSQSHGERRPLFDDRK